MLVKPRVKMCPSCGSKNDGRSRFCLKCGDELPEQDTQANQLSNNEITYSPSRTNNYKTTKGISSFLKLIAWLSVGAGVISALGALSSFDSGGFGGPGIEFYVSLISTFSNFTVAIFFAALSEGINVMLDIEANSRQTAKTLERLLRSQE